MGQSPPPEAPPDSALTWACWPARGQPGRAALVVALILLSIGAVATADRVLALPAALALLHATGDFLLPTRYRLDAAGVHASSWLRRRHLPWDRVAGTLPAPGGLLVQARAARPWLARRRSVLLRDPPPEARARLCPPLRS